MHRFRSPGSLLARLLRSRITGRRRRPAEPPHGRSAEPPRDRSAEPPGRRSGETSGHGAAEPPGEGSGRWSGLLRAVRGLAGRPAGLRALVHRLLPAAAYPVAMLGATGLADAQPPSRRAAWLAWASTDLANLAAHPVGSLVTSAFVTPHYAVIWAVLSVLGLASTAARLGAVRTVLLAGAVHVLATLVSQGVVAVRIHLGTLADDARAMLDVGPSYVVVAALVAGIGFGRPHAARVACAAVLVVLAPALVEGLTDGDVAALGHTVAMGLALAAGALFVRWWPPGESPP